MYTKECCSGISEFGTGAWQEVKNKCMWHSTLWSNGTLLALSWPFLLNWLLAVDRDLPSMECKRRWWKTCVHLTVKRSPARQSLRTSRLLRTERSVGWATAVQTGVWSMCKIWNKTHQLYRWGTRIKIQNLRTKISFTDAKLRKKDSPDNQPLRSLGGWGVL